MEFDQLHLSLIEEYEHSSFEIERILVIDSMYALHEKFIIGIKGRTFQKL
ncbi:MAG: hypothetical protein IKN43_14050 [Selenomonadaceae bacterium]|nr:hypothetical protein [Selenomonadaceae bacterium]